MVAVVIVAGMDTGGEILSWLPPKITCCLGAGTGEANGAIRGDPPNRGDPEPRRFSVKVFKLGTGLDHRLPPS